MTVQLNLEGERSKLAGMSRAVMGALDWAITARKAAYRLGLKRDFTSDDVVSEVGLPNPSDLNANNAVGGLLGQMSMAGLIRRIGHTQSTRPEAHARLISVWRLTSEGLQEARNATQ